MKKFSNPARVRQKIQALARQEQPKPMFESWESIPLHFRLLILEHITFLIDEARKSQMRSFQVRIAHGTNINSVVVSARSHEEAFEEAKRVLHLENENAEGTVVPQ